MKLLFLLLLILVSFHSRGQVPDTTAWYSIFGCSCCSDTLKAMSPHGWLYIVSDNDRVLTAYKAGKQKWSLTAREIWASETSTIDCVEFRLVNEQTYLVVSSFVIPGSAEIHPTKGQYFLRH